MKHDEMLKIIAKNISAAMQDQSKDFSPRHLSDHADLSYTTLSPILKGERDFRVSNLIALANALNVTPNDLLKGCFKNSQATISKNLSKDKKPLYLVSLITNAEMTHCYFFNTKTQDSDIRIHPFSLSCGNKLIDNIDELNSIITTTCGDIPLDQISIYASVLAYEHIEGREKLKEYYNKRCGMAVIEPDWFCLHNALLPKTNGILITINNGYAISYSNDKGNSIQKLQGYSFPISDAAGNFWLGCKAIEHTINSEEGVEERSLLSDRILSLVNSDLNSLAMRVYDNPRKMYLIAAGIVKELASNKDKPYEIIKEGFDNIWKHIKQIDHKFKNELPIYLAGDLAYLYEEFIPKKRLMKKTFDSVLDVQFKYSIERLMQVSETRSLKNETKNMNDYV